MFKLYQLAGEIMRYKKTLIITVVIIAAASALLFLSFGRPRDIVIQEAKMVTGVDKSMSPLKVTNLFPKDTAKVCAWIRWKNALVNTQVLVKWYFVSDDVPIYDYNLNIPKKDGIANVVLSMPEGKTLPSGSYKVTIFSGKNQLREPLTFEIQ